MTDRELLIELFTLLVNRKFIQGDKDSILDMVQRYKQPPMTRLHQVAMQMTRADYDRLGDLLETIAAHLYPKVNDATDVLGSWDSSSPGNLPPNTPPQQ